jgi:hypothetical protein
MGLSKFVLRTVNNYLKGLGGKRCQSLIAIYSTVFLSFLKRERERTVNVP